MTTEAASVHPASEGLRLLADKLDALAAAGCVPPVKADIRLLKGQLSQVCQHLDLVSQPIPPRREAFEIFRAKQTLAGLEIEGWNFLGELCERKVVTRQVEQFVCDLNDLEMPN